MVKTHKAQDYPLEQFKTVIIFSVTKYIPLILMVNLTPGILYHGNKNCDVDKNNIASYRQIFILSGGVTDFMQGYCKDIKCDKVLNIPG